MKEQISSYFTLLSEIIRDSIKIKIDYE